MSTRSHIACLIKSEDTGENAIKIIYCHSDGYPSHQYPTLLTYYDFEKVTELMQKGSISFLEEYNEREKIDYYNEPPMVLHTIEDYFKHCNNSDCEYEYLYIPNEFLGMICDSVICYCYKWEGIWLIGKSKYNPLCDFLKAYNLLRVGDYND